jgi:hypothetical protein
MLGVEVHLDHLPVLVVLVEVETEHNLELVEMEQ